MRGSLTAVLLSVATVANAHIALWDKGMFGLNRGSPVNYNDNEPVTPLREMDGLSQAEWFGHGYKGFPPNAGDFMVLPAGGIYTGESCLFPFSQQGPTLTKEGEHACNRAETTLRDPAATSPLFEYACQGGTGALHVINSYNATVDPTRFGGTALAIAYTSDINSVQPNDFTVISVLQQSVWTRRASYSIPKDLPACPTGGCIISWNWIHRAGSGEGYPFEIYNLLYRGTVTGATSNKTVMRGQVPRDCTTDPTKCVSGPKTPMYLYQADGNNLPHLDVPPMYNNAWGFQEGAQNDIFQAATTPAPTTGIFNPYASQTTQTGPAPTATSLPKGWQPLGCFMDQDVRALDGGRLYMGSDLTIEMGTKMANDAGWTYAMLENGNELWVGNRANLTARPAAECNVRCGGDPQSLCGGPWRGTAFVKVNYEATATGNVTMTATATSTAGPAPTEVLPSGWSVKGCSIDRDSPRALNRGSVNMGNMTNAYCASICQSKGYPYAGTEYRSECWCGDQLLYNATASPECNEKCSGNQNYLCGGSYRITILQFNANSSVPTGTPTTGVNGTTTTTTSLSTDTTTTSLPTNTTTTNLPSNTTTTASLPTNTTTTSLPTNTTTTNLPSNTTTTSLPNNTTTTSLPTANSTSTLPTNTTSRTTTTTSSSTTSTATFATFSPPKTTASTTTTTSTTTTSPTPSSNLPAGYVSLGCWKDSATSRIMPDRKFTTTLNTPKYCIEICAMRGYRFAGVENGKDCYCASATSRLVTKATDCTLACDGNKNQKCGNTLSIEVFGPTGTRVKRNQGPGAKGKRIRIRRPAA